MDIILFLVFIVSFASTEKKALRRGCQTSWREPTCQDHHDTRNITGDPRWYLDHKSPLIKSIGEYHELAGRKVTPAATAARVCTRAFRAPSRQELYTVWPWRWLKVKNPDEPPHCLFLGVSVAYNGIKMMVWNKKYYSLRRSWVQWFPNWRTVGARLR